MGNTFTSLHYHIVFSTKNRTPFLRADLRPRMHEYVGGCIREGGGVALQIGGVDDHIHILAWLKATHCLADVLRNAKKGSSEWVRADLPRFHWQDGYSAFSVSRSQLDRVQGYIQTQEEHHRKRTFEDEYRELLIANGIAFDERYLL